jgi:nucleotide-binding universal stress UspA family protein
MKILVPLDGSALSESILFFLEQLMPPNAELYLLRVSPGRSHASAHTGELPPALPGEVSGPLSGTAEPSASSILEYLETLATGLRGRGIQVTACGESGNPTEMILEKAQTFGVNLIAMTTHGRSGLSRLLFGSVTEGVLRRSPVPVITLSAAQPRWPGEGLGLRH